VDLTGHARWRMGRMGVGEDEVALAVSDPEVSYASDVGRRGDERVHVRGRLAVVVADGSRVVTVLWRGEEGR
jgi:hypothetical protein